MVLKYPVFEFLTQVKAELLYREDRAFNQCDTRGRKSILISQHSNQCIKNTLIQTRRTKKMVLAGAGGSF